MTAPRLGPESKILRLENGAASEDGLKVMFEIVTTANILQTYDFNQTNTNLGNSSYWIGPEDVKMSQKN